MSSQSSLDLVAARLLEEWTVRPDSLLPSVWEMVCLQQTESVVTDATRTAVEAMGRILQTLVGYLHRQRRPRLNPSTAYPTFASATTETRSHDIGRPPDNTDAGMERTTGMTPPWWSVSTQRMDRFVRKLLQWATKLIIGVRDHRGTSVFAAAGLRFFAERYWLQWSHPASSSIAESMYGLVRVESPTINNSIVAEGEKPVPIAATGQWRLALLLALGPLLHELCRVGVQRRRPETRKRQLGTNLLSTVVWTTKSILMSANVYCHWRYMLGVGFPFSNVRDVMLQQTLVRRHVLAATETTTTATNPSSTFSSSPSTQQNRSSNGTAMETYPGGPFTNQVHIPSHPQVSKNVAFLQAMVAASVTFSWLTHVRSWYQQRYQHHQQQQHSQHHHQQLNTTSADSSNQSHGTVNEMHSRMDEEVKLCNIPPPLMVPPPSLLVSQLPLGSCLLCGRLRPRQPTALQTTGCVFCYGCIVRHVRDRGSCPTTGEPVSETQLVRLFEPVLENKTNRRELE